MSGDNPGILMGKEGRKEGRRKEAMKKEEEGMREREKEGRRWRRELENLEKGTMS